MLCLLATLYGIAIRVWGILCVGWGIGLSFESALERGVVVSWVLLRSIVDKISNNKSDEYD